MNLAGAVLLDKPTPRRGLSHIERPEPIGYRKDGRPIYSVGGSSLQTWSETLISSQIDGTAVNTTTTPTTVLPPAAKLTLPANYFSIGKTLRVNLWGRMSTFTSGTLTIDVRFGSTVVFNGGAMVTVISLTNKTFRSIIMLTCRSIGNSTAATMFGSGDFTSSAIVGSTGGAANDVMLPDNAPAVGTGFDSTVSNTVDVFATWSVSSASNSIQSHMYTLEAMN